MRALLIFLSAAILFAQDTSVSTKSTTDLNGNREAGSSTVETRSKTAYQRTEIARSINGSLTPLERVEERVIKEDASGRTVERIVRRFDPAGNPGPPERTITEEQTHPDGLTIRTTVYRADLNGNMAPSERSLTETHKGSGALTSMTTTERPGIGGAFEAIEKKSLTRSGDDKRYEETAVTYRRGESGFYAASQVVTQHSERDGQSIEQSAEYHLGTSSGKLELQGRTVTTASKSPDGSAVSEVDHFGTAAVGAVNASGSGLKLREREVVERRPGPDGSVTETVSVRRPTVSDPGVLGPAKVVSEIVCRGKCQ